MAPNPSIKRDALKRAPYVKRYACVTGSERIYEKQNYHLDSHFVSGACRYGTRERARLL